MKLKTLSILIVLLVQQIFVFSQPDPLAKYLPANAGMIMSFNPIKIANKVPGETFRQSYLYKDMMKKDDGELKVFLSDPSISGIDFSYDLKLVVTVDTSSEYSGAMVNVFGVLKNEALFSLAINKLFKGKDSVKVYGTNKMVISENSAPSIAWNNEIFVISGGKNGDMNRESRELFNDTTDKRDFNVRMQDLTDKLKKMQRNACFELLTPKSHSSIYTDAAFTALMSEPGDIRIWNNGNSLASSMGPMRPLITGVFSKMQSFTGTTRSTVINFENGKIAGFTRNYIGAEMAALYQKYTSGTLNTDLIRRLPKGKILGMFITSMNPELGKEIIQHSGMAEILDSLKGKLNFDFNLFTSSFKSSAMVAVMSMPVENKDVSEESKKTKFDGMQLIIALPIADKLKFEELRIAVTKMIDSLKAAESGEKMTKDFSPILKYNDSLCVISLSEEVSAAYLNNPVNEPAPAWLQEYTTSPMVANVNIKEIINLIFTKSMNGASTKDQKAKKMLDIFDQLIVTGGEYRDGILNNKAEFLFSNPDKNAIHQLFEMLSMAAEENEKENKERSMKRSDSQSEVVIEEIKIAEKESTPPPPPPPPKPPKGVKMQPVKKTKS